MNILESRTFRSIVMTKLVGINREKLREKNVSRIFKVSMWLRKIGPFRIRKLGITTCNVRQQNVRICLSPINQQHRSRGGIVGEQT